MSSVSIDPSLWGPSFWSTLHWTAAAYPVNPTPTDKTNYKVFYENLQHTLPCSECREHYSQLLSQMPIDPFLVSGKQLRQWVTSLHNTVNSRTENAQRWTLLQVDQKYLPANPEDSTWSPPVTNVNVALPVSVARTVQQVRIPPAPVKLASVQRGLLHSMRQQQKIMSNNARTLGRIQKVVSMNRPTMRRPVAASAHPAPHVSVEPKKKKGCGCNKKK